MKILCLWPQDNKTHAHALFKKAENAPDDFEDGRGNVHGDSLDSSLDENLGAAGRFVVVEKPESALIRAAQPFFVPDWAETFDAETMLAVRIDRLGRYIAPRFAHRYYTEATVALAFTARDLLERLRAASQPWDVAVGFDQSVAVGRFVEADRLLAPADGSADRRADVDEGVSLCSRFYTLKSGDLLLFSLGLPPQAVKEGDTLCPTLGDERLLTVRIK